MDIELDGSAYVKQEFSCDDQTTETMVELQNIKEEKDELADNPPCAIESVFVKMPPTIEKDNIKAEYTDEDLKKTLVAMRKDGKLEETPKAFDMPHATPHDLISGKRPEMKQTREPDPILGVKAEDAIKDCLIDITRRGFTVEKEDLLDTVQKIIKDNGIHNPFKYNRPGQTWYENFLKRHPDLSVGADKGNEEATTEESIRSWFANLETFLKETSNDDILKSPDRIFSGDECSFSICPKTGEVAPEINPGHGKENLTAFVTCNAKGQMCNPLVIFPCKRPSRAIVDSTPGHWCLGRSDTGRMTRNVFYEYVANDFNNWVERYRIKRPILLLVDGRRSSMSLFLNALCDTQQIILYALPPNSTCLLQPVEACVFGPLKSFWTTIASKFLTMPENIDSCVTKTNFCKLFKEIIEDTNSKQNIQNGFKLCGLYPFNPNAVDYSKCVNNTLENYTHRKSTMDSKEICNEDLICTEKVLRHLKPVFRQHNIDVDLIINEARKLKRPETDASTDIRSEDDTGSKNVNQSTLTGDENDQKMATNCSSTNEDSNEGFKTNESSTLDSDTSSLVSQDEVEVLVNRSPPIAKSNAFSGHLFYPLSPERTHKAKLSKLKGKRNKESERSERQKCKRRRL